MANLTIVAADVAPVEVIEAFTGPAKEAILKGQYVRYNVTDGKIELGKGTETAEARKGGIAILGANAAGITITAVRRGIIDIGDAMSALDFDADVFLSDTDGTLADTAGSVSLVVGTVVPAWNATTADKLLRIEL
jgi:hypothetical protein